MNIVLSLPPTTNKAYKIALSRMYKSDECRTWETVSIYDIKKQHKKLVAFTEPLRVNIELYLKHWRDIDGSIKLILDVMQMAGVYKNDRQVMSMWVNKEEDKKRPRVEIEVLEL